MNRQFQVWALKVALFWAIGCSSAPDRATPGSRQTEQPYQAESESTIEQPKIVFLGDSLTAGYGVDPEEAFPALLQEKILAEGFDYEVVNAGESGGSTAGGLRRLDWLLRGRVEVLVVGLGGNDGLRGTPVESTRDNLMAIIDRAKDKGIDKILLLGQKIPPNLGPLYFRAFEAVYPQIAESRDVALVPFLLEDVAGEAHLNQVDGIHPNAAGHRIMAENVWPELRKLLW